MTPQARYDARKERILAAVEALPEPAQRLAVKWRTHLELCDRLSASAMFLIEEFVTDLAAAFRQALDTQDDEPVPPLPDRVADQTHRGSGL